MPYQQAHYTLEHLLAVNMRDELKESLTFRQWVAALVLYDYVGSTFTTRNP